MNRKLNIRSSMFLFVLSMLGLLFSQAPAQSENLKLDSLKANFPPGERYFSLGKRDPFVPLVGSNKKGFKKVSSQPSPIGVSSHPSLIGVSSHPSPIGVSVTPPP